MSRTLTKAEQEEIREAMVMQMATGGWLARRSARDIQATWAKKLGIEKIGLVPMLHESGEPILDEGEPLFEEGISQEWRRLGKVLERLAHEASLKASPNDKAEIDQFRAQALGGLQTAAARAMVHTTTVIDGEGKAHTFSTPDFKAYATLIDKACQIVGLIGNRQSFTQNIFQLPNGQFRPEIRGELQSRDERNMVATFELIRAAFDALPEFVSMTRDDVWSAVMTAFVEGKQSHRLEASNAITVEAEDTDDEPERETEE